MTSAYPRSLCTVWEQTCSLSPDSNGTACHLKRDGIDLLLEAKKPLERTPHFLDRETVNVLTLPASWPSPDWSKIVCTL